MVLTLSFATEEDRYVIALNSFFRRKKFFLWDKNYNLL